MKWNLAPNKLTWAIYAVLDQWAAEQIAKREAQHVPPQ